MREPALRAYPTTIWRSTIAVAVISGKSLQTTRLVESVRTGAAHTALLSGERNQGSCSQP